MALKKPRKMVIDGELYHWKASRNGVLHFAVRQPGSPKRRMVVNFSKENEVAVTPGLVKNYIDKAVAEGWGGSLTYWHERKK